MYMYDVLTSIRQVDRIVNEMFSKNARERHRAVLCSSASISIPPATYTKRQEFRTYAIECFDLNMFSDREKLLCEWFHLLREPI